MQEYFSEIQAPRHQGYIKHKLEDILVIIMCADLCGLDELCTIMEFAQSKKDFLKKHFNIEAIPSKPTMSRILTLIDGKQIAEIILKIMQEKITGGEKIVAVDGKAIRSTSDKSHNALQILTVYLTEKGIVPGQEKINKKTNEISVFQQMLEYLDVKGKIFTAEAMHCRRETSKVIIAKKGDYVFG